MRRLLFFVTFLALNLAAARVETTVLGQAGVTPPLSASDSSGNLLLAVNNPPCAVVQADCAPITLVKVDALGKVLLRRNLGAAGQRISVAAVGLDVRGNILVAGTTTLANLATVRPLQAALRGESDIFLWQLAPDGERVLFASYLGGAGVDAVTRMLLDGAGNPVLVITTRSADFPFTARLAGRVADGPRSGIVKVSLASPKVDYAVELEQTPLFDHLSLAEDGSVNFFLANRVLGALRPDGQLVRLETGLPAGTLPARIAPVSGGGFWVTGSAVGVELETTGTAIQRTRGAPSYYRVEGIVTTPEGPAREAIFRQIVVDPAEPYRLYAITSRGLLRSDNNGWGWTILQSGADYRSAAAIAAGAAGRVWVNTATAAGKPRLLVSDDQGAAFRDIALPVELAQAASADALAAHARNSDVLYIGAGALLASTQNGGQTWTVASTEDPVLSIAVDPNDPLHVIVHAARRLLQSTDGGMSFGRAQSFPASVSFPFFDPFDPGAIYFQEGGRLRRTARDTFPDVAPVPGRATSGRVVLDPTSPGVFFSFDRATGRLLRSADRGITWEASSERLPAAPTRIAVSDGGVCHIAALQNASDGFVARLDREGKLAYLSYLGGAGEEAGQFLLLNGASQLIVAGTTNSPDFPLTQGRLRGPDIASLPASVSQRDTDFFVTTLNRDGSLASSVALGSSLPEQLLNAFAGPAGSTVLFGVTQGNFPGVRTPLSLADGPVYVMARVYP